MADKEIKPKDPQATEVAGNDERDEEDRKSQGIRPRFRKAGRKSHAFKGKY